MYCEADLVLSMTHIEKKSNAELLETKLRLSY